MPAALKPLRITVLVAAALGLISITLSGEITPAWCVLSWAAWAFSLASDRFPQIQALVRRLETVAVAGMVGMIFLDFFAFHYSIFITVTHFLLLFQIVKLVGGKTRKDCLQIFIFSFFQILAACTLSVDPWHAAVLLALIPTAAAALFWNQIARESEKTKTVSDAATQRNYRRMNTRICAAALPINLLLTIGVFVLFPRLTLNAPLGSSGGQGMGYTDQVNLAQKGNLQQDAAIVLWLSFPKAEERQEWNGYLRGDVLSVFNGHGWSAAPEHRPRTFAPDSNGLFYFGAKQTAGPLIHQTITLLDTSAGTLFTIGNPLRVAAPLFALQEHEGGSFHWLTQRRQPLHYDVISEAFSPGDVRPEHVTLPASVPLDRIRALAAKVAGKGPPLDQARNIELFLSKNYRYSTNFGDRIFDNPVETFLFDRHEGSCGHFASALALMLRLRHIPSRLVAGYLKGEWNEPAQAVVIRDSDAHAWVEAYIAGQGWISLYPTPRPVLAEVSRRSFFNRIKQYSDYFGLLWNRFVIQYDLYSQIKAFENLKGSSGRLGAGLARWWSKTQARLHPHHRTEGMNPEIESNKAGRPWPWKRGGLLLFLSLLSLLALTWKRPSAYDSSIRFYSRFLERMNRAGYPKYAWETGEEFMARLARMNPGETVWARQMTEQYYNVRFKKDFP